MNELISILMDLLKADNSLILICRFFNLKYIYIQQNEQMICSHTLCMPKQFLRRALFLILNKCQTSGKLRLDQNVL